MCTFADDYVDYCNNIDLFCSLVRHQQTDEQACDERDLLPREQEVTLVYGGLRHGRSLDIGGDVCLSAWDGDEHRYDLYADLSGFYPRLYRCGLYPPAALLSAEPDHHLFVSGTADGTEGL